jgi:hypothetical protein
MINIIRILPSIRVISILAKMRAPSRIGGRRTAGERVAIVDAAMQ